MLQKFDLHQQSFLPSQEVETQGDETAVVEEALLIWDQKKWWYVCYLQPFFSLSFKCCCLFFDSYAPFKNWRWKHKLKWESATNTCSCESLFLFWLSSSVWNVTSILKRQKFSGTWGHHLPWLPLPSPLWLAPTPPMAQDTMSAPEGQ